MRLARGATKAVTMHASSYTRNSWSNIDDGLGGLPEGLLQLQPATTPGPAGNPAALTFKSGLTRVMVTEAKPVEEEATSVREEVP